MITEGFKFNGIEFCLPLELMQVFNSKVMISLKGSLKTQANQIKATHAC